MSRLLLLPLLLLLCLTARCQKIRVQSGYAVSDLQWHYTPDFHNWGDILDKPWVGYYSTIGIQYFERDHFNISSDLGYITKRSVATRVMNSFGVINPTINYLIFTTTADIKYPVRSWVPFISLGPHVQHVVSYSHQFEGLREFTTINNFAYGLLTGIGLGYSKPPFDFGIKADYLFYKSEPIIDATTFTIKENNTITIGITVAYKVH